MISLSAPGKTFLLGEHVATAGGPSILISTDPPFELRVSERGAGGHPFAAQSPAGLYLAKHREALSRFDYQFIDHHKGRGGLGASSAQFLLLMAFHRGAGTDASSATGLKVLSGLTNSALGSSLGDPARDLSETSDTLSWARVLAEYRECAWNGQGTPPSGADVVSQFSGGITWFDGVANLSEPLAWKFESIGFTLIRTGHKVATHELLREGRGEPHASLRTVVREGKLAFETNDEMRLIEAVTACAHVLRESGLTTERTLGLLEKMRSQRDLFYAVKGCGAMGADIILALHEKTKSAEVEAWAKNAELETCGSLACVSDGLVVKGM